MMLISVRLHHLFLALLRMGGYRVLTRVRPRIIYIGHTSHALCDKGSSSILSTLVSLGSLRVCNLDLPPNKDIPSSIPLGSTLSTFEMASRVERHDSHAAGYLHNHRCPYNQKGPKPYTPLS